MPLVVMSVSEIIQAGPISKVESFRHINPGAQVGIHALHYSTPWGRSRIQEVVTPLEAAVVD